MKSSEAIGQFGVLLKKQSKGVLILLSILVVVILAAGFFFTKYQEALNKSQMIADTSGVNLDSQIKSLIEKVGKSVDLPKDETPAVATVSDIEKVKNQPFFAKAKNGDKVLIYNKARKAILYRPSTGKIIEVTTINPPTATPAAKLSPTPTVSPSPTPTLAPIPTPVPTG